MARKLLLVFVVPVILIAAAIYLNTDPKSVASRLAKTGFSRTDRLTYRMYLFGFIPACEAIFDSPKEEALNGKAVLHLNATVRPLRSLSRLFNGYAILDSYIDAETGDPVIFRQKTVMQGKVVADKEVRYDQKGNFMTKGDEKRQILPHTQDPLSLVYNLRKMKFAESGKFDMNINTNQKNYIFEATLTHKGIVIAKAPARLALIKSTIRRRDKNRYHRSQVDLVCLKDKENLPILIKVSASGFYLVAKLVNTN
ncbi:MAG: DUF3108 domain-containing protein [Candidatus Omnitrophota bacterium]